VAWIQAWDQLQSIGEDSHGCVPYPDFAPGSGINDLASWNAGVTVNISIAQNFQKS
jgi:hypothetical protein